MVILLDYDGTLTPIAPDPSKAKIDPERKKFLEKLSRKHGLAVVTGRSMDSFREVFGGIPPTIYVATSHGAKIYRGEELVGDFSEREVPDLGELERRLRCLEGTFLERKDGCFALHYRKYKGDEREVKRIFYDFVRRHPPRKIIEGKRILEAIYGDFDKGKAVERILEVVGRGPREELIYIGDDTTDLYALRKVRELGGRAVFVGSKKPPEADTLLRSVDDVYKFLASLDESAHEHKVVP